MVSPIDFTLNVQDPIESVRRGVEFGQAQALRPELLAPARSAFERTQVENQQADVRFGQGNVLFENAQQDRQAAIAQAATERQNAIQMRADLEALTDNPSAAAYAQLSTKYPEIASELTTAWNLLDKSEQESNLRFMGGLYSSIESSIKSGNDERTVNMLEDRIEALTNTPGREEEAQQTQAYLETFRADPESARTAVGVGLSVLGEGQFDQVLGGEASDTLLGGEASDTLLGEPPLPAPKLNEGQGKATGFYVRMKSANDVLERFDEQGLNRFQRILEAIPGGLGRDFQDPEFQLFDQARRNFVNSVLRRESGATISESEFANAERQYFPTPGDQPEVIEQKRKSRENAILAMRVGAGPGADYIDQLRANETIETPPPTSGVSPDDEAAAFFGTDR